MSLQQQILALDPLAYYPLQRDALDASGNGYDGSTVIGSFGAVPGVGRGIYLDGTSGIVTTPFTARRNYMPNPSAEVDAGFSTTNGAASTPVRSTDWASDGSASFKVVTPGTNTYDGIRLGGTTTITVAQNDVISVSVRVKNGSGASRKFTLGGTFYTGGSSSGGMGATTQTAAIADGAETTVTVTFPAVPAGKDSMSIFVTVVDSAGAAAASTYYVDSVLVEKAAAAGSFFPTRAQLTSGEAGWLGTADASFSDLGCFANGTVRTFLGVYRRDDSATVDTLIGGFVLSNATVLKLAAGSGDLLLLVGGNTYTYTGAWPSDGLPHLWALEFDEPANTADLYIDGVLAEAKTAVTGQHAPAQVLFEIGAGGFFADPANGPVAHVAVNNGALSPAEHAALYGVLGVEPGYLANRRRHRSRLIAA